MTTQTQEDWNASAGVTLEQALAENGRFQGELEHMRSEHALFGRAVSHELRTAMQAASGFTELLDPGMPRKKMKYYFGIIQQELDRLAWVADEVHLQAELDGSMLPFQPAIIQVTPLLEEAARACEARAPRNIVHAEWQPGLPSACADPRRVRQVVDSLLIYAVRFLVKGNSEMSTVTLGARTVGDFVEIAIRGEWPGIAPEYGDTIFDRVVEFPDPRGDPPRRGLRLGLYAARQIARRLNGDLVLQGGPERRCAFIFTLPIARRDIPVG